MIKYKARWYRRKFNELRKIFGGKCCFCGTTEDLQFAHIHPTRLNGEGRGTQARYYDIKNNPDCYRLMCNKWSKGCHHDYDEQPVSLLEFDQYWWVKK